MELDRPRTLFDHQERFGAYSLWSSFISQYLATSVEVFLHRRFGERYIGLQAAAVLPAMLVYSLFWQGHNTAPLMMFVAAYMVMVAGVRVDIARRRRSGDVEHSYYNGFPEILRLPLLRRWLSERAAKRVVEPLLVGGIGVLMLPTSEPLGLYLMIAGCALRVTLKMADAVQKARLINMRDAYFDQMNLAEQFRKGNRRW